MEEKISSSPPLFKLESPNLNALSAVKYRLTCYYVSSFGDMTSATRPLLLKTITFPVWQTFCSAPSRQELPDPVNLFQGRWLKSDLYVYPSALAVSGRILRVCDSAFDLFGPALDYRAVFV